MSVDSNTRSQILLAIKKLLLAHHINVAGVDYGGWTTSVDEGNGRAAGDRCARI